PGRRRAALQLVDEDERLVDRAERPVDQAGIEGVVPACPGGALFVRDRDRRPGSRLVGGRRGFVAASTSGGGPERRDGCGEQHDENPSSHLDSLLGRRGAVLAVSGAWR